MANILLRGLLALPLLLLAGCTNGAAHTTSDPASVSAATAASTAANTGTAATTSSTTETATAGADGRPACVGVDINVTKFEHAGASYALVDDRSTWTDAATCAAAWGGRLVEIDDAAEQAAIFSAVTTADIQWDTSSAGDGGGFPHVWLGANDLSVEGTWLWDGANTGAGVTFWQGKQDGQAVDGHYNNWGNEPSDGTHKGQDAGALVTVDWTNGKAGTWNDIWETNTLVYVVEWTR